MDQLHLESRSPNRQLSLGFFNQRALRPTFSSRRLAGVERAPVGNEYPGRGAAQIIRVGHQRGGRWGD